MLYPFVLTHCPDVNAEPLLLEMLQACPAETGSPKRPGFLFLRFTDAKPSQGKSVLPWAALCPCFCAFPDGNAPGSLPQDPLRLPSIECALIFGIAVVVGAGTQYPQRDRRASADVFLERPHIFEPPADLRAVKIDPGLSDRDYVQWKGGTFPDIKVRAETARAGSVSG